jgi:hypothetical protein
VVRIVERREADMGFMSEVLVMVDVVVIVEVGTGAIDVIVVRAVCVWVTIWKTSTRTEQITSVG